MPTAAMSAQAAGGQLAHHVPDPGGGQVVHGAGWGIPSPMAKDSTRLCTCGYLAAPG
jgi:hypothetical protein